MKECTWPHLNWDLVECKTRKFLRLSSIVDHEVRFLKKGIMAGFECYYFHMIPFQMTAFAFCLQYSQDTRLFTDWTNLSSEWIMKNACDQNLISRQNEWQALLPLLGLPTKCCYYDSLFDATSTLLFQFQLYLAICILNFLRKYFTKFYHLDSQFGKWWEIGCDCNPNNGCREWLHGIFLFGWPVYFAAQKVYQFGGNCSDGPLQKSICVVNREKIF